MKISPLLITGMAASLALLVTAGCGTDQTGSPYHPGPVAGTAVGEGVGTVAGNVVGFGAGVVGGTVDGTGMSELGYTWNANSTWSYNSGLYPPINQWSFVVMVIQPTKATLYLMNSSGTQSATNAIAHDTETFGSAWHVGDDTAGGATGGRTFPGSISDVGVYLTALTPSQVTSLYNAGLGNVAPPNVMIQIAPNGLGGVTLTWPQGVLLQASSLTGPWTTNAAATSPYTVGTTNSNTFFKVQVQ